MVARPADSERPPAADERSLAALLSSVVTDVLQLVRDELALVRADLGDRLRTAKDAALALFAGGLIACLGLVVLLEALVAGLAAHLPVWAASLLVGCTAIAIGLAMLLTASNRLRSEDWSMPRTRRSLRRVGQFAQPEETDR